MTPPSGGLPITGGAVRAVTGPVHYIGTTPHATTPHAITPTPHGRWPDPAYGTAAGGPPRRLR